MAHLEVYVEFQRFLSIKLGSQEIRVGRSPDCDIQLPSEKVSRHHTTIAPAGEGNYSIEDLSTNGTRVNSEMVHGSRMLVPGDRIYIGTYVLVFQADENPRQTKETEQTLAEHSALLM